MAELALSGQEGEVKVNFDENGFPKTLLDWRREPEKTWETARHLWDPLEQFFEQKGYILFIASKKYNAGIGPKDENEVRSPDPYHHVLPDDQTRYLIKYLTYSNKYCAATRKSDHAHVMIQLVCKGSHGQNELEIMRYLNAPTRLEDTQNHTLPILEELAFLDMTFIVLPLLHEGLTCPWYHDYAEAFDAIRQSIEAVAYLHENNIAHCDIGLSDFLLNFGGSRYSPAYLAALRTGLPFRSSFPSRYYLIDFELAIQFPPELPASQKVVCGLRTGPSHGTDLPKHYGKPLPPEWVKSEPYCPFAGDVYQLGKLWLNTLQLEPVTLEPLKRLLETMIREDPVERPLMAEALSKLDEFLKEAKMTCPSIFFGKPVEV